MDGTLRDLAERWRCGRRAALRAVVAGASADASEDDLLKGALAENAEAANRGVFENSLRLGVGFARYHGTELSLEEVPSALCAQSSPCCAGTWERVEGEPAMRLERSGCAASQLGPAACDYWREAIDGLVLGVTGGIRHARYQSLGHGDSVCVDVLYVNPESVLRYGPIPSDVRDALAAVSRQARMFDSRLNVEFVGLSEGVLFYRETSPGGPSEVSVTSFVERAVRRRFPHLRLQEVSPRPVLTGDGAAASDAGHQTESCP